MTWAAADVVRDRVKAMGAVPDMQAVIRNGDWMWVFRTWSYDYGAQGEETAYRAANFLADLVNLMDLSELQRNYIAVGSPMDVGFSEDLVQRTDQYVEGFSMEPEPTVRDALFGEAYDKVEPYHATFVDDVEAIQTDAPTVSDPMPVAITRDRIDRAVVDAHNDSTLKGLDRGEYCAYEQCGDMVFLEPPGLYAVAPTYRAWMDAECNSRGFVQMMAKGKGLDPGEIKVTGSRSPDDFKTAIRRVTRKKVTFG